MSFASMKKNSGSMIEKLRAEAEKAGGGKKSFGDDRIWKPTVDKAGNGYAIIRFLPAVGDTAAPWVQYWDHGFKGPTGRWYIEKSLTSIGQDDPVSELNSKLWNSGVESDKEIARSRKRRLHYVSNIMVVSDPKNPENNGKVFLYVYGKKIFDKVMDIMNPEFEDETPVNPFDFWEGANFKLKIRQVEGFRNYDKSEFDKPSALLDGDDEKLETVYDSEYDLGEFTDPKQYKSYDELKKKLYDVLGETAHGSMGNTEEAAPAPEVAEAADPVEDIPMDFDTGGDTTTGDTADDAEDTMSYFAELAKDG